MATLDIDISVDMPEQHYVRILALAKRIGAEILSRNVNSIRGDQRVDFLYRISGLASFATEWKRAVKMTWAEQPVKVLALDRIIRSKEISNRPKDLIQLPASRDYLACSKIARIEKKRTS